MRSETDDRWRWVKAALPWAWFAGLAVLFTWPLALHLADAVAGRIGDNIYFVFLIGWYEKAVLQMGISPFFSPLLNYPQGWNLASTDTSLATTLFGMPLGMAVNPTAGYNSAMLLTFVFAGWAMFYTARRLTGSAAAGLVAGTIYACLPYRLAHFLAGHLNLSGVAWFPLFFLGVYELLRGEKFRWRWALLAGTMLGLTAFTSMYYLYMLGLVAVPFVLALAWSGGRAGWRGWFARGLWGRLAALGLCALPWVALAALPFLQLNQQGGLASRDVAYASMYSASPTDFLLPSTDHFLWGRWVGEHFDRSLWIEATLYVGVVSAALAVVGWRGRRKTAHRALFAAALTVMAVSFVLALGVDFHWLGQRVELTLPGFLQERLGREAVPLVLPGYILFKYLPFFSKMRALMRIGFFLLLFTALLAGFGAADLLKRAKGARGRAALTGALIALALLDFYPGPLAELASTAARPVDAWLAEQPGQGAVAQLPAIQLEDQDQVYYTLAHGKPYIGGFFSANQPEQYLRIREPLAAFPAESAVDLLRDLKVRWVVVDTREYPDLPGLQATLEAQGLRPRGVFGDQAVFEIPGS